MFQNPDSQFRDCVWSVGHVIVVAVDQIALGINHVAVRPELRLNFRFIVLSQAFAAAREPPLSYRKTLRNIKKGIIRNLFIIGCFAEYGTGSQLMLMRIATKC